MRVSRVVADLFLFFLSDKLESFIVWVFKLDFRMEVNCFYSIVGISKCMKTRVLILNYILTLAPLCYNHALAKPSSFYESIL